MTSLLPHFLFLLLLKKNTFTLQQQPEFIFFLSTASLWNHWIINCVSRFQVKKNRRVACFPDANFCPWRRIHRPTSLAQSLDIREQIYSSLTILLLHTSRQLFFYVLSAVTQLKPVTDSSLFGFFSFEGFSVWFGVKGLKIRQKEYSQRIRRQWLVFSYSFLLILAHSSEYNRQNMYSQILKSITSLSKDQESQQWRQNPKVIGESPLIRHQRWIRH